MSQKRKEKEEVTQKNMKMIQKLKLYRQSEKRLCFFDISKARFMINFAK